MRIPLHNTPNLFDRLELHMHMRSLTNDKGFRIPPTSQKNPKKHSKQPTTRVEELARDVGR